MMALAAQPLLAFSTKTRPGTTTVSKLHDVLAMLRHSTLPDTPPTGFIVLSGHAAAYRLGLCAAADRALAGETVLYVAGANVFDPFLIGRLARANRVTPSHILQRIHVSRAFTCHQMVRLVTDCLSSAIERYGARWVILSGPLETLYDESVPDQEATRLFHTMQRTLQHLAQQDVRILCVSPLPAMASTARRGFLAALRAHAHRTIDVRETEEGIRLHEDAAVGSNDWTIPRPVWSRL